jgi:hypothetical protein
MPIGAAHWLLRAQEARMLARLCGDPALRHLLEEVAQSYDDLAASRRHANERQQLVRRGLASSPHERSDMRGS